MQVLLEYKIFNSYFHHYIRSEELKENIRVAFADAISNYNDSENEKTYKYYRLEYDDNFSSEQNNYTEFNKSKIIKTSSLMLAYNYFLFENREDLFNNCINYWLENDKNTYPILLNYTIKKMRKYNRKIFIEDKEYVDLMNIFRKFFSQDFSEYIFKLYEVENPVVELG